MYSCYADLYFYHDYPQKYHFGSEGSSAHWQYLTTAICAKYEVEEELKKKFTCKFINKGMQSPCFLCFLNKKLF